MPCKEEMPYSSCESNQPNVERDDQTMQLGLIIEKVVQALVKSELELPHKNYTSESKEAYLRQIISEATGSTHRDMGQPTRKVRR